MAEGQATNYEAAPKAVHALLLDDDEFDRRRICRMSDAIGMPIMIEAVPTLETMAQSMRDKAYDLVLVDYHLSDGDGFSALDMVHANARNKNAATIMISGSGKVDVAVAALKAGCSDYLSKQDMSPESLRAAFTRALNDRVQQFDRELLQREAEKALIAALQDQGFRRSLLPTMVDAIQRATETITLEKQRAKHPNLSGFLADFAQQDDFCFELRSQNGPIMPTAPGTPAKKH